MEQYKKLMKLFVSTFMISAFTFGGGYVIVPLFRKKFVEQLNWIEDEDMLNLIAIAQTAPGAIAINASIAIGYRVAKIKGALVALVATFLPPMCILMLVYTGYELFKSNTFVRVVLQGMQIGVCAVVLDVIADLLKGLYRDNNWLSWGLCISAIVLTSVFGWHILLVIFMLTGIGMVISRMNRGQQK